MSGQPRSDYPLAHRLAFASSQMGWRGSSYVWKLADALSERRQGLIRRPDGIWLHANVDDWTAKTAYEGTYERPLVRVLPRLLSPGDAVIDVGANIGFISSVIAPRIGRTGLLVMVEPSGYCVEVLQQVVTRMEPSVEMIAAAVGACEGEVQLSGHENPRHRGLGKVRKSPGFTSNPLSENVQQVTLDSLSDLTRSRTIGLLKVDVEGYEEMVMAGSRNLLRDSPPRNLVLEVSPNFGDVAWVGPFMESLSDRYVGFAIEEIGKLRRTTVLHPVDGRAAVKRTEQWNLLLTADPRRVDFFISR